MPKNKKSKKRVLAKTSRVVNAMAETIRKQEEKINKIDKRTKPKKKKPQSYLSVDPRNFLQKVTDEEE